MNYEKEIEKAKKELINLFLKLVITNKQEVNKLLLIYYILKYHQIEQSQDDYIIQNNLKLNEKPILDLINLLRDTIDMIISLKVNKLSEYIVNDNSKEEYEKLLRQVEAELRKHIGIQNQLKVQLEKMQLDEINNEVSLNFTLKLMINRKRIIMKIKIYI